MFGRDMVLPHKFMTDWGAIEQQRQKEMAGIKEEKMPPE
jgi:hypothetical protein